MARFNKIRKMDIANGPGVRASIFFQGCPFHCKGCFNRETWDFSLGNPFDEETINKVLEVANFDYIKGLSILGGEPLCKENIDATIKLCKAFKERYPEKNIWLWTGFTWETLDDKRVLEYLDTLVDGTFKEELHDPRLKWCGSSNQRVIDVKKSLKENKIILYESEI